MQERRSTEYFTRRANYEVNPQTNKVMHAQASNSNEANRKQMTGLDHDRSLVNEDNLLLYHFVKPEGGSTLNLIFT